MNVVFYLFFYTDKDLYFKKWYFNLKTIFKGPGYPEN